MEKPIEIRWHQLPASETVTRLVEEKARKLEHYYERIIGCSVTIEAPNMNHHRHGKHFRVRVEISVPGDLLVVGRDATADTTHEDVYLAVHDAFRAAKRQLQDFVRRRDDLARAPAPNTARINA